MASQIRQWAFDDIRSTGSERHAVIPRLIAGVPLLAIGLAHVFDASTPIAPLVEAAGFPAVSLLSPAAVAIEIIAGTLLILGLYSRLAAVSALPVMAAAIYAHVVIDVWPNAGAEPPIALPAAVMACAAYVLWRGAGAWSLDRRLSQSKQD